MPGERIRAPCLACITDVRVPPDGRPGALVCYVLAMIGTFGKDEVVGGLCPGHAGIYADCVAGVVQGISEVTSTMTGPEES